MVEAFASEHIKVIVPKLFDAGVSHHIGAGGGNTCIEPERGDEFTQTMVNARTASADAVRATRHEVTVTQVAGCCATFASVEEEDVGRSSMFTRFMTPATSTFV